MSKFLSATRKIGKTDRIMRDWVHEDADGVRLKASGRMRHANERTKTSSNSGTCPSATSSTFQQTCARSGAGLEALPSSRRGEIPDRHP